MNPITANNYVLGRGKLYLNAFATGTLAGVGERYLGNSSSFQFGQNNTDLTHYSSDEGLSEMDFAITTKKDFTGTIVLDNIAAENVALWFAGKTTNAAQSAASSITENMTVSPGYSYQLGRTANNPMGVSNLANMSATATLGVKAHGTYTFNGQPTGGTDTVTIAGNVITFETSGATGAQVNLGGDAAGTAQNLLAYINTNSVTLGVSASGSSNVITVTALTEGTGGNSITISKSGANIAISGAVLTGGSAGTSTTLVAGTDWAPDPVAGRYAILIGGGVSANSGITVTYDTLAAAQTFIVTDQSEVYGAATYRANNPAGLNTDYYLPYLKLVASGTYEQKSDALQAMTFQFDVLKLDGYERVYGKQRPANT